MPTEVKKNQHWGEWISERASALGITTQVELAAKVGVAPENVSRLLKRAEYPRLRAKSLAAFAAVLHTHEGVIRKDWETYDPATAPAAHLYPFTGKNVTLAQLADMARQHPTSLIEQVFESPETLEEMRRNTIFLSRLLNPERADAESLRHHIKAGVDHLDGEYLFAVHKAFTSELQRMVNDRRDAKVRKTRVKK